MLSTRKIGFTFTNSSFDPRVNGDTLLKGINSLRVRLAPTREPRVTEEERPVLERRQFPSPRLKNQ